MQLKVTKLADFLNEALPLSLAKKYQGIKREKIPDDILKQAFSKFGNKDRVYIELPKEDVEEFKENIVSKCNSYRSVSWFLKSNDVEIIDFVNNVAKEPNQKNFTKITKVLSKLKKPELLDDYIKDWLRIDLSKNKERTYKIVLSKAPYDIAGMSTDRSWESCMKLDINMADSLGVGGKSGVNARYVPRDVERGTIVAYLISSDDTNIKKPFGRVLIKPFVDSNDSKRMVWFPETSCYGNILNSDKDFKKVFRDTVKDWVEENINIISVADKKEGTFHKAQGLYNDDSASTIGYEDNKLDVKKNRDNVSLGCVYETPFLHISFDKQDDVKWRDMKDEETYEYEEIDVYSSDIDSEGNLINPLVLQGQIESYLNDNDFYETFINYIKEQGWIDELDEDDMEEHVEDDIMNYYYKCFREPNKCDLTFMKEVIGMVIEDIKEIKDENNGQTLYKLGYASYDGLGKYLGINKERAIDLALTDIKNIAEDTIWYPMSRIFRYSDYIKKYLFKTKKFKEIYESLKNSTDLPLQVFMKMNSPTVHLSMYNISYDNSNYQDPDYGSGCPGVPAEEWDNCITYQFSIDSLQGNILSKLTYSGKYNPYC